MNRRSEGPYRVLAVLLLVGVAAFAGAQRETGTLIYVHLSDLLMIGAQRVYAAHLEADLGVGIELHDHAASAMTYETATRKLQIDPALIEVLRNADVVTVLFNFRGRSGYCVTGAGEQAYGTSLEEDRAVFDAFLTEPTRLVDPECTVVRIVNAPVLPKLLDLWHDQNTVEVCLEGWIALNGQLKEAADAFGILLVDVFTAWNGETGLEDAQEFFTVDRQHVGRAGDEALAGLLRASGYAPLRP